RRAHSGSCVGVVVEHRTSRTVQARAVALGPEAVDDEGTVDHAVPASPPLWLPVRCVSRMRAERRTARSLRRGTGPSGRGCREIQCACCPRENSKTQPTSETAPRAKPTYTSHQPTARPRKTTAAEPAIASGHQLHGA